MLHWTTSAPGISACCPWFVDGPWFRGSSGHSPGVTWAIVMVKKTLFQKKTRLAKNPMWEYVRNILADAQSQSNITKNRPTMAPIRVPRVTLAIGEGVRCSCKIRYLRPSQVVAEVFVNADRDYELDNFIAFERKVKWRKGKPIASYFFQSASLPGTVVSCAEDGRRCSCKGIHPLFGMRQPGVWRPLSPLLLQ